MKLKRYLMTTVFMVFVSMLFAQNATQILDKVSATLNASGNVKVGFSLDVDGNSGTGYIKLQGKKFIVNMGGSITWFDGKTMWTYVKENEEVNVTNPTAAQVAKMNPYAFVSFYKKGYKASIGKSTASVHEVILTGQDGSAYSSVVLEINKKTNLPQTIMLASAKGGSIKINCNSFLKNQKYTDATFRFNKKNYPKADVIDLR